MPCVQMWKQVQSRAGTSCRMHCTDWGTEAQRRHGFLLGRTEAHQVLCSKRPCSQPSVPPGVALGCCSGTGYQA